MELGGDAMRTEATTTVTANEAEDESPIIELSSVEEADRADDPYQDLSTVRVCRGGGGNECVGCVGGFKEQTRARRASTLRGERALLVAPPSSRRSA